MRQNGAAAGRGKKEVSGMISFLLCLAILVGGYFVYGKIVDNTFGSAAVFFSVSATMR